MAKSRHGGYESSKPVGELRMPPRGPAPGAGKVTNSLAPIRITSDEDARPAGTNPCVPAGSNVGTELHGEGAFVPATLWGAARTDFVPWDAQPTDVSDTRVAAAGLCAGPPDPTTEREGTGRPSAPTARQWRRAMAALARMAA